MIYGHLVDTPDPYYRRYMSVTIKLLLTKLSDGLWVVKQKQGSFSTDFIVVIHGKFRIFNDLKGLSCFLSRGRFRPTVFCQSEPSP